MSKSESIFRIYTYPDGSRHARCVTLSRKSDTPHFKRWQEKELIKIKEENEKEENEIKARRSRNSRTRVKS